MVTLHKNRVPYVPDEMMRTYFLTEEPIVAIEEGSQGGNESASRGLSDGDLGIGKLETGE